MSEYIMDREDNQHCDFKMGIAAKTAPKSFTSQKNENKTSYLNV